MDQMHAMKLPIQNNISPISITSTLHQVSTPIHLTITKHSTHTDARWPVPMPHESPLHSVHSLGRDEGSLSLNELTDLCTSLSNKGRSLIEELDMDVGISLVPPHEANEGRNDDTQIYDLPAEQLGVFSATIALADAAKRRRKVSTAAANLVYIRKSAQKRKDKGKAIMEEDEFVQKKTKKQLKQKRLGHKEAIRLQEQIDEEERQRIARDAKIAKQLQEEINKATQEQEKQEVVTEADPTHIIDWSDPAVIRYHALQNRDFLYLK
ncbi:hypothetical protein Tco_0223806 [Tanacetum coccineum]